MSFNKRAVVRLAAAATATACAVACSLATPAAADSPVKPAAAGPVEVVADGLNGPRQVSVYQGRLYVPESDKGQVSVIDPLTGAKRAIVTGLATPQGAVRIGNKIYVVTGDADPDAAPSSAPSSAVLVAEPGGTPKKFADLLAYERKKNPDGQTQFGPDGKPLDTLSNPYIVVRDRTPHGLLIVADAGANDLLKVDKKGRVSTLFVPPTVTGGACAKAKNNTKSGFGCDAVPTGLAYGPGNLLYISALTSEVPGQGRVYVINPRNGKLVRTIKGLTAPTGVAVSKHGTVYTSQVTEGAPEGDGPPPAGFDPSTVGQIVKITRHGRRSTAQVTMPSGLLVRHGELYAATWAIASFLNIKDAGQIVIVPQRAFHRS